MTCGMTHVIKQFHRTKYRDIFYSHPEHYRKISVVIQRKQLCWPHQQFLSLHSETLDFPICRIIIIVVTVIILCIFLSLSKYAPNFPLRKRRRVFQTTTFVRQPAMQKGNKQLRSKRLQEKREPRSKFSAPTDITSVLPTTQLGKQNAFLKVLIKLLLLLLSSSSFSVISQS